LILDAGFLISVDRGERVAKEFLAAAIRTSTPLNTSHPVVAQVWRDGARQVRLARFLSAVNVHAFDSGRAVGSMLARSRTSDVVDAHLVCLAMQLREPILTGDVDDISTLINALTGPKPTVIQWP
jgi:hypothetical protein